MAVPRTFVLYCLALFWVNDSLCVTPLATNTPLIPGSPFESPKTGREAVRGKVNDAFGLVGTSEQVVKTIGEKATSINDTLSSTYNLVNGTFNMFNDTVRGLLGTGLRFEESVKNTAQIPMRLLSGMAYAKMDNFESIVDTKEKREEINKTMSTFMNHKTLVLPDYLKKSNLLHDKYLEAYKRRCVAGDCFTFDNIKVYSLPTKVGLNLPYLAEIDYAYQLFKQSGAHTEDGLLNRMSVTENYNSFDHFILMLAKHNLDKFEFLNNNDEAVNIFYYRATLFYKKFTLESDLNEKYDASKTFTSILGFYIKSDLLRIAELSTYNKNMTLTEDELVDVSNHYRKYLAEDVAGFVSISDSYAKLCHECLQDTREDTKPNHEMIQYLESVQVFPEEYCVDQGSSCEELVNKYLKRCENGDCYTFDNIPITENIKLKILVPYFPQVTLALNVFKNSKAHRGTGVVGFFKKLFRLETTKTLKFFIKMLARHNIKIQFYNDQSEKVLNEFLYQATLFFARFMVTSRIIKFYSWNKATLWMFSVGRSRYLKNLAKDITFGTKVALSGHNLSKIIDDYSAYLVNTNKDENRKICEYFAGMCKRIILRHVVDDRIATEMFGTSMDIKPEDVCKSATRTTCVGAVTEFLARCKAGDCYTLDIKDYYTSDRMYKIMLPILFQVDAALYVFKRSKSYGYYAERFVSTYGPNKKVDPYVQFYRNLVNHNNKFLVTKTFENEVLAKYLYNSAVYFKFVGDNKLLDTVDISPVQEYDTLTKKMESFLKRLIKSLVGVERVRFRDLDVDNAFEIFNKHLHTTHDVADTKSMSLFMTSCKRIFRMFKEMQNNDQMYIKYRRDAEYS